MNSTSAGRSAESDLVFYRYSVVCVGIELQRAILHIQRARARDATADGDRTTFKDVESASVMNVVGCAGSSNCISFYK